MRCENEARFSRNSNKLLRVAAWSLILWTSIVAEAVAQINAPAGRTLFLRKLMVRTDLRVFRLSKLIQDGSSISDPLDREVDVLAWETQLVYGLARNTAIIAGVPFITRDFSFEESGRRFSERSTGFGDATFLLQYDGLYSRNRIGGFTRLSATFGVKAPIGERAFSTDSADLIAGIIFSDFGRDWKFSADVEYLITTSGSGVERGNVLFYNASVGYFLLKPPDRRDLFLIVELNGRSEGRAKRDGLKLPDTGGHTIFISPGVEYLARPNIVLEFSAPISVWQDLNGLQLGRGFTIVTGIRYLF